MKIARIVIGILLIAAGVIWIGQGLGYIPGSFMTGERMWAYIGLGCVVIGSALIFLLGRSKT